MQPADVAARALAVAASDVRSVEPIKHGLTNRSWLVRTDDAVVVVRISNVDVDALQIDRTGEALTLNAVAAAGIGPDVLLCEPAKHLLVTRYHGATWTDENVAQPSSIARVGELLRRLHSLSAPGGVPRVDLARAIERYLRTLDEHGVAFASTAARVREQALEHARALSTEPQCLCHNDVHALNLIDDGILRLIDWEYAGLGAPSFDLASVCIYQRFRERQRGDLLAAYCSAGGIGMNVPRLDLACWLFEYVRELWLAVRSLSPRQPTPV